jgi:hypothetical protein
MYVFDRISPSLSTTCLAEFPSLLFPFFSFLFFFFVLVEKEGETGGKWKTGRVGNGWGWWRGRGGIEGGKVCV